MEIQHNPFSVKTPENLSAEELIELFVPYPEFELLQDSGHQFLHGHRGSGKSMVLRMLEPDCQTRLRRLDLAQLPFFGVYLSIKATEINQPEFERLENEPSGFILSEHVLVTKVLSRVISSVARFANSAGVPAMDPQGRMTDFYEEFERRLVMCGWNKPTSVDTCSAFDRALRIIDVIHSDTLRYVKRRAFSDGPLPYEGVLLGFQDVLLPLVDSLRKIGLLPDCPVFILLDDADNLTLQQTQILNTWVSYRSTALVSLKISTQLSYKTYQTSGGVNIESPHDFSEITFANARTGRGGYSKLVEDIVARRLLKYGLDTVDVRNFFPEDGKQAAAIAAIELEMKERWVDRVGGGFRAADDAYRLARPEFMRRLGGKSKQSSSYKYAGFEQLVHISSGIIRFFLDPAARMFSEELKKRGGALVDSISPDVQDDQIRRQSDSLLIDSFESLKRESCVGGAASCDEVDRLRNLIVGLGYLFHSYLIDEFASQRRVFSFFLSDNPSPVVQRTLQLGVRLGYLYKEAIGRKEGRGRAVLYVLTRRLAPAFKLDPMGFSGYVSVTDQYLGAIILNPNRYAERKREGESAVQLHLEL